MLSCFLDLNQFPFDTQVYSFKLGSLKFGTGFPLGGVIFIYKGAFELRRQEHQKLSDNSNNRGLNNNPIGNNDATNTLAGVEMVASLPNPRMNTVYN